VLPIRAWFKARAWGSLTQVGEPHVKRRYYVRSGVVTPDISRKNQYLLSLVYSGFPPNDGSITPGNILSINVAAMLANSNILPIFGGIFPIIPWKYSMEDFALQPILRNCNTDVTKSRFFPGICIICAYYDFIRLLASVI